MKASRNPSSALRRILLCAGCLLLGAQAEAQLNLPQLPTPQVPLPGGLGGATQQLDTAIGNTVNAVDTRVQATLRATRIRELIRANRTSIEADPNGAPMVRSQLVAVSPSAETLARVAAAGFTVVEQRTLEGLGLDVVVLSAPNGLSTARALRRLRALDPNGSYDYNHIYMESGEVEATPNAPVAKNSSSSVNANTRLGLIDSGVEKEHPVFHSTNIHSWGCEGEAHPSAHGTAVASLMVGQGEKFRSAAAGATLYAADVYCGQATGGALNAIAQAFSWLAQEHVPVINISLVGPPNILLEQLVRATLARGHLIVAAVGNDGPAAAPLYPAGYPGVIGVTAVDAKDRVLVEAARGKQVSFAAPGADMAAATVANSYAAVRGTSFAAPIVAGLLAACMEKPDVQAAEIAVEKLSAQAMDLGSRGPDKNYGKGLVGESLRIPLNEVLTGQANTAGRSALIKD